MDNLCITARRLSDGAPVALPAVTVLFGEDKRLGWPQVFSTSTGTAARDSRDAAETHALFELVERDLVAIWWYNRLTADRIDPDVCAAALPDPLSEFLRTRRRQTVHLRLPSDLPACAIVAISCRADGSRPAIGASAAADPVDALRSATLECLQGEIALAHMRAAQRAPDPPPPPLLLSWSQSANAFAHEMLCGTRGAVDLPSPTSKDTLVAHCAAHGIDLYAADISRPELGVPVVKAVSPHLRDWLPRFGPGRLYDVPVALGLRRSPTPEERLNPVPFVI